MDQVQIGTTTQAAQGTHHAGAQVHWPEAFMEALGLGVFMVCAGVFGTWLEFPGSAVHQAIPSAFVRRVVMGALMGVTAIGLVYSPWGKRSGAHINPAVTLTFLRLGRVQPRDAVVYVVAQFLGGLVGVMIVVAWLGDAFVSHPVDGVATVPGMAGVAAAFMGEAAISFVLMLLVLTLGRSARLSPYTGLFVGCMVCLYITFEAPVSGMSMNPARTLASAIPTGHWQGLWIYFTAPPLGMLTAAELQLRFTRNRADGCAKLFHKFPCIFCGSQERAELSANAHRAHAE
jgi:aquaporin Z